jgi:iron complex transport system substrate-binding protein
MDTRRKMMKKKFLSIFTAAMMGLSVVACGAVEQPAVAETNTLASEEGFPMTITHGLGETVLTEKPQNVVAIA